MSHTITVTRTPDESSDDYEYEFGGTHGYDCEVFTECCKVWHRHPSEDTKYECFGDDEWSTKRAGPHKMIDGVWMIEQTDGCALRYVFESQTVEETLEGVKSGETRAVTAEWDGGRWTLAVHKPLGGAAND
jgi:hypothetical protein